ncbi:hypothetical protein [Sorangium sp. So ce1097]|uniref:hypothetical protein n=1 Tax=Sorangium sp. So ce1097 TaxID=3133330 RepID=UPI003F5E6411
MARDASQPPGGDAGLTEAMRAQVDEHWRARITADARAGEAWRRAHALHRNRLLGLVS